METDETVQILRTLADDEGAPARVDLAVAVATGRKRRHRRRLTTGLASGAVVALVVAGIPLVRASLHEPPPTRRQPTFVGPTSLTCTEHELTLPGGGRTSGAVTAGDPTGRYLAGIVDYPPGRLAIWDQGVPTVLNVPASGSDAPFGEQTPRPADVTPGGAVLGNGGENGRPWLYTHGTFTALASFAPTGSTLATAIGDQGTIGGTYIEPGFGGASRPIMWTNATSPPVELPLPASSWDGFVTDVDTDGTILGGIEYFTTRPIDRPVLADAERAAPGHAQPTPSTPPANLSQAVVWRPGGSYEPLPLPPGIPAAWTVTAVSIRHGIVVVIAIAPWSDDGPADQIAFLYDLATGRYTRLPGAELSHTDRSTVQPVTVRVGNAQGWLVEPTNRNTSQLYTPNTGRIPLPMLGNKYHDTSASTISDDGSVIGGGDASSTSRGVPVYWACR